MSYIQTQITNKMESEFFHSKKIHYLSTLKLFSLRKYVLNVNPNSLILEKADFIVAVLTAFFKLVSRSLSGNFHHEW